MRIIFMGAGFPFLILSTLFTSTTSTTLTNSTPSHLPLPSHPLYPNSTHHLLQARDLINQNLTNDDGGCSLESTSPFFKFTIDNLLESQAIEAYTEWIQKHALSDLQLQQYGEVGLFGIRVINDPGLRCGEGPRGSCELRIQCGEMRDLIEGGRRDEARRRYFITLMIKYTFDYMQDIIESATAVQEEIKDRIVEIVKDFTENNEAKRVATCEFANSVSWGLRQAAHSLSVFCNDTFAFQIDEAKVNGLVKPSEADQVKARVIQEELDLEEDNQKYMQPENSLVEGKEVNLACLDPAIETDSHSRMNKIVAKNEDGQIYRVFPKTGDWLKTADGKMQKVSPFPDWTDTSAYRRLAYLQTFRNETWKYGWQRDSWLHVEAIDPQTGVDTTTPLKDEWSKNYLAASCDSGKPFTPNSQERQEALINRISAVFEATIKDLKDRVQLLAHGTADRSALSDSMQGGFFLGHLDVNTMQPLPSLRFLEETMRQKAYEAVISNLLVGEGCYAKCVPTTNTQELMVRGQEKDKKNEIPLKDSRFIPEENRVCQWECIGKSGKWPHQTQMFGIDKFGNYSLNFQDLSTASYHAWKDDYRNPENLLAKVITAPHDTQFRMPTCDSEFNVLNDFRESDFWDKRQLFPACCGNWRCNETQAFMNAMKINLSDDNFQDYAGKSLIMAAHLTIIRPYTHYNALCELNISYNSENHEHKDKDGNKQHIVPEKDSACSTIAEQTRNMTEDEANIFFCTDAGVKETVLKKEGKAWMGRISPPYRAASHQEMCDEEERMPNLKCLKTDEENFARRSDSRIWDEEFRRERDDGC